MATGFEWVYTLMTAVTAASIMLVVAVMLFMWRRANSVPAPGFPLGSYEIIGRYPGNLSSKRVRGVLVDSTAYFLSAPMQQAFKELMSQDLDRLNRLSRAEDKEEIKTLKEQFNTLKMDEVSRMVITRDGVMGEKHLFVQIGDPSKLLNSYATLDEDNTGFNLSFGQIARGIITGKIMTMPERWVFDNEQLRIGKVVVHTFIPDVYDKKAEKMIDWSNMMSFSKLAVQIPNALDIREQLRSYSQQLKDKEFQLAKMGTELSGKASQLDYLSKAVKGFLTEGQKLEDLVPSKVDIIDFICMFLFPLIGLGVGIGLGDVTTGFIGTVVGSSVAGLVIHKRG